MNDGYGSATWLSRRALMRLAAGEKATADEARELADEVYAMRGARVALVESMRTALDMLCEKHGPRAGETIRTALRHIATPDEIYGCPPTDTPPSAESGDPPPRARSSG